MSFATAAVFYLVLGLAVALAVCLADQATTGSERLLYLATALFFWPFHLALLLQSRQATPDAKRVVESPVTDALARDIQQVEAELDSALASLDGWAEDVLADEQQRMGELRTAWRSQAERIREIDRLLSQPGFAVPATTVAESAEPAAEVSDRQTQSERGRVANIRRLHQLRDRMFSDFEGTLAWVRELATMIHLAKFSGAPASRAEELVAQVAAAVEGLREALDWRDVESPSEHAAV